MSNCFRCITLQLLLLLPDAYPDCMPRNFASPCFTSLRTLVLIYSRVFLCYRQLISTRDSSLHSLSSQPKSSISRANIVPRHELHPLGGERGEDNKRINACKSCQSDRHVRVREGESAALPVSRLSPPSPSFSSPGLVHASRDP